ncbi:MAG TPA: hypothetical protein VN688_18435 [Gemmataceae bacterium]|nr:hypothetical protein [Gemmataceae bacterium]
MNASPIIIEATLQPDGLTLQLDNKLTLPPGRVTLTVRPAGPKPGPTMLEVLDRIHRDQQQGGRKSMTEEEMAAEIAQRRIEDEEYEQRWRDIWGQTGDKTDAA